MRRGHAQRPRRRASAAPLPRIGTLVAAVAMATTLLAAVPPLPHADASTTFTFEGGGFGHSVGMSQFGAYGMSREGASWQDIMTHYFTGATPGDAHPSQVEDPIWVNLTMEQTSITFTVFATGAPTTRRVVARLGGQAVKASVGETIALQKTAAGCRVTTPEGSLEGSCSIDLDWDGFNDAPKVGLELAGCSLLNWNAPGGSQLQPCRYARGGARIRPDNNTATMNLSIEIDIEDYILGISEMPYAWGDTGGMAALEAQAVAARSYALHRAVLRGDASDRPWCWCHLYDTTVDQHYVGWGHGTQNWIDAVHATAGKVMHHPSEEYAGNPLPIETFYSSSTFGWTENSEHGFISYVPYLRSVNDHWSQLPDVGNHSARWTRTFSGSELASLLPGMSTVTAVEITDCSPTGAALELTFHGSGGPRAFKTRSLRSMLSLRSMQIISIDGTSPCTGPGAPGAAGPAALATVTIDDDAQGDSLGDGDGVAECGETIEMWTAITTDGGTIAGVTMDISTTDPHVSVVWNTSSTAADVAPGTAVPNDGDWDLAISPSTPSGHRATLDLAVGATNGGPWQLQVPLDIACGAGDGGNASTPEAETTAAIGDVNGNGTPDLATAITMPNGRKKLVVTDGSTGNLISSTAIGGADMKPVVVASVAETTGPAHRVAVALAHESGSKTRLVIVDARTGTRVAAGWVAGAPIDLEPIPDTNWLTLTVDIAGRTRIKIRDAASAASIGRLGGSFTSAIDTEPIGNALAVLGVADRGAVSVRIVQADGSTSGRVGFGRSDDPLHLSVMASGALTVVKASDARAVVDTRTASGELVALRRLAVDAVLDVEQVDGRSVALLVLTDGRYRVFVVDTPTGALTDRIAVNSPALPVAIAAYGAGSTQHIAVLGSDPDGPRISVTDRSGSPVSSTRLG